MGQSLSPKRERFAQEIANGNSQAEAYRIAFDCANSKPETITANASRLVSDSNVATRIKELRDALAEKALWSREDSVKALIGVINSPDKQRDIVAAVKELNLMHGFEAPKKIEHSGGVRVVASSLDEDI